MKIAHNVFLLLIIALCIVQTNSIRAQQPEYEHGQVFVKLRANVKEALPSVVKGRVQTLSNSTDKVQLLFTKYSVQSSVLSFPQLAQTTPGLGKIYSVTIASDKKVEAFIEEIKKLPGVEYAERVPKYNLFDTPNDLDAQQWGLKTIHAAEAWDISKGSRNIKIAIVDDAVKITHPDLAPSVWTNPLEIPDNNKDDDNNGYVDDVHGWDCADSDSDPNPPDYATVNDFTHGTHCAGIAAAATDNGLGVASIGHGVSIIPVKCKLTGSHGSGLTHVFQGVAYAIAAGADVISMSWGGGGFSQAYQDLFAAAHEKGIVLVAAAGNDNTDIPMYPASYKYIISVGASDINDRKASFSNYGATVDVMAPGRNIYSTLADATVLYGALSGTSMACPMTAGLVALMKSRNPYSDPDEIESCLKESCDPIDMLNAGYENKLGAGRINAYNSVLCIKPGAPKARFEVDFVRACSGVQLTFFDRSKGTPATSWQWQFPGGIPATSTEKNPKVLYSTDGKYDVTLIACNEYGCDTIFKKQYITIAPPKASIAADSRDSLCDGAHIFIEIDLEGVAPWTVAWSDGTSTFIEKDIPSNKHYISLTPKPDLSYSLVSVSDRFCSGIATGKIKYTLINCSGFTPRSDNVWYFGKYAGLDFSNGKPIPLLNSAMDTYEGCATISDDNGNLLFYTDGLSVWNKDHKVMPNGAGLYGHSSSTQSAVVAPDPTNTNRYYLFSVATSSEHKNGLYYSILDMTLDGGRGDVTSIKNVFMMENASEKVAATWHANKKDVWIVSHENSTSDYYTFLLSSDGVSAPIITPVGKSMTPANVHGYMRFSHAGAMLAMGFGYAGEVQLCKFNNTTGVPSKWVSFKNPAFFAYGVEFSPDDSKLYIANHIKQSIYQFDLNAGSDADIKASALRIGSTSLLADALQLGPDGKIYVALFHPSEYTSEYLGVIPNPNDRNATYLDNNLYLGGRHSRNGLPDFIQGFRKTKQEVLVNNDTVICLNKSAQLSARMKEPGNCKYFWRPSEGLDNAFIASPIAQPNKTTVYVVTALAPDGLRYADSVTVYVDSACCIAGAPKAEFTSPETLCLGDTLYLKNISSSSITAKYTWTFGNNAKPGLFVGATPPPIWYSSQGLHIVRLIIEDSCGSDTAIQNIKVFPLPIADAGHDTSICSIEPYVLGGENLEGMKYLWQPGTYLSDSTAALPKFIPPATGNYKYIVTITNPISGCRAGDTVHITVKEGTAVFAGKDTVICKGSSIQLHATGAKKYRWSPTIGLDNPLSPDPIATPEVNTTYTVIADDSMSCISSDEVTVTVVKPVKTIVSIIKDNKEHPFGDTAIVTIRLTGIQNPVSGSVMNAFSIQLKYNSTPLQYLSGSVKGMNELLNWNFKEILDSTNRTITILGNGDKLIGDTAEVELSFIPFYPANGELFHTLYLEKVSIEPQNLCVETGDLLSGDSLLKVPNGCASQLRHIRFSNHLFTMHEVRPNPVESDRITVEYSIGYDVRPKFIIYNTIGEQVTVVSSEFQQRGEYSMDIDISLLGQGVYCISLEAGQYREMKMFVKQ